MEDIRTETRNKYFMDENYRTIDDMPISRDKLRNTRENYFVFWYIINPQGKKPYIDDLTDEENINLISQNITRDVSMKAVFDYIDERLSQEPDHYDCRDLRQIKQYIKEAIKRKRKITI